MSLAPGLLFGAMWLHTLEPWPLSSAQGPDTERPLEGFRRVMGLEPSEDIDEIYYKGYEIRDYQRFLRFSSCSQATRASVLEGLERLPSEPASSFLTASRLDWWFQAAEAAAFEHWGRPEGYFELWTDPEMCVFYVVSWTT